MLSPSLFRTRLLLRASEKTGLCSRGAGLDADGVSDRAPVGDARDPDGSTLTEPGP